jgi:hypothetical protein
MGNLHLLNVFNHLSIMMEIQNVELNATTVEHQKTAKPINVHNCLMGLFWVSHFTLHKVPEQVELLEKITSCTGHFSQTWGIPCVHFIHSCI